MNRPFRLVLSPEQSAAIRESGIRFAVVHPGSWPDNPGRYVLDLIKCDAATATAAVNVALGLARAHKIKQPPST